MKVRVVGAGWYGSHLALSLMSDGHEVEVWEKTGKVFSGASGNMPGRLHRGFHYPRSKLTRAACQRHTNEFLSSYGNFVRSINTNIYAVASDESLIDYGTYYQIMDSEEYVVDVTDLGSLGLKNVEGAILTREAHVVLSEAALYFSGKIGNVLNDRSVVLVDDPNWDLTIDTSFCALDAENIDRYEACLTVLLEGPVDKSITVMDGPFSSVYVFDEKEKLSSLSSAFYTPMKRTSSWSEARMFLDCLTVDNVAQQSANMFSQMTSFCPRVADEYRIVGHLFAIRAMPRSASDARLVDIIRVGERALRIRAGKLDAIFHAEREIKRMVPEFAR